MRRDKKSFTSGEVADLCGGVSYRTAQKWIDAGLMRGYRLPGSKDRRVPREELVRFMRENGMPLPSELEG